MDDHKILRKTDVRHLKFKRRQDHLKGKFGIFAGTRVPRKFGFYMAKKILAGKLKSKKDIF